MKTVLTSIITSIITVIIVLAVVHYFCDDSCETTHEHKHKTECCDADKAHKHDDGHGCCAADLVQLRKEFDVQLSDEEKATIEAMREKFADVHCEKMCPEGKKKFMEEHKADFEALLAIADNYEGYFKSLKASMHEGHEKVKSEAHKCPEAKTCKEATEKCKGEGEKTEKKVEKKAEGKECKEAKAKCEECFDTFKIHFLLMDTEKKCEHDHEHGHDHDHEH